MRLADKSSFQPRRVLEAVEADRLPAKRKFSLKKISPHISTGRFSFPAFMTKKKRVIATGAVLTVVLVAAIGYGYYQYQLSQNPAVIYAHKLHTLTQQVGKYTALPADETPVIATVSDVTKLPQEAFFTDAKNGDKILLYKKHKKAILYRPSTDQVITTAVLDFKDIPTPAIHSQAVAGASTSAQESSAAAIIIGVTPDPTATPEPFVPHGKILVQPQH